MSLAKNSKYFFLTAVLSAILIPDVASRLEFLVVPLLIVVMTVSLKDVGFRHISKRDVEEVASLTLLNYVFLGAIYMLVATLFESPYKEALMLLGIMPPAAGIISLSKIYHGDMKISFLTEFTGYFVAMLVIPIATPFLFDASLGIWSILETVFYIMILPFVLSRFLHNWDLKHPQRTDHTRLVINTCYSFAFFVIIGLNIDAVFDIRTHWDIYVALFLLKFGIGTLLYLIFKNKVASKDSVLIVLFGTFKNGGAALAFALLLFGPQATIPYAIGGITTPLFMIYLEWLLKK